MTGKRYDELFAKQARIEREMLGLSKHQELWRAREELGTESWAVERILRKFDIIQSMRTDNKAIVALVFRDPIRVEFKIGLLLGTPRMMVTPWVGPAIASLT